MFLTAHLAVVVLKIKHRFKFVNDGIKPAYGALHRICHLSLVTTFPRHTFITVAESEFND